MSFSCVFFLRESSGVVVGVELEKALVRTFGLGLDSGSTRPTKELLRGEVLSKS